MKNIFIGLVTVLVMAGTAGAMEIKGIDGERVFIVNDYRYEPGTSGGDVDRGHALCGNRCNALSVNYRNFIDPGGYRFIKVASNREVVVDLENPFFEGKCVCIADEFVVQVNEFNWQSKDKQAKEGK